MHTYISDITKSYLEVIRDGKLHSGWDILDLIWLNVGPFFLFSTSSGMKTHSLASHT